MKTTTAPLFFLPQGHPAIKNYKTVFDPFTSYGSQTHSINIHRSLLDDRVVASAHEAVLALQHYPHLIHKLLFNLEFTFSEREGSNLHIARRIWQQDSACHLWFRQLMDLPFMLFFLNDEDARYYALLGDFIATGEVYFEKSPDNGITGLGLTDELLHTVQNRLFNACLSIIFYCHGSGFNPVIYVQGLLAFFDASFTYEDVLCEYANDVLKGTFRMSAPYQEQE